MARRLFLTIALIVCVLSASVSRAAVFDGVVTQILESRDLRGAKYAVCVIDADTGEVLADVHADEPMIPASNMKLLTTASALDVLGKDFVFRTDLSITSPAVAGASPDLVIHGDGDPALGDPELLREYGMTAEAFLDEWVKAIRQSGVTSIRRLIIDDSVFDRPGVHPSWPVGQLNKDYCAQVAGLNFHANCLHVLPSPGAGSGSGPRISLYPDSPFLETYNNARTGKSDSFWIDRKTGSNVLTYQGTVKNRFFSPVRVTLNDPPMYLARLLRLKLSRAGIRVDQIQRINPDEKLPPVRLIHRSQTLLPAVLNRTNRDSQNLFAESLLKRMGFALTGSPGNWENGPAAVRHALSNRMGTNASSAVVVDGSGMSRDNRVTARILASLLYSMHHDKHVGNVFKASLSYVGKPGNGDIEKDGTLSKRFRSLPEGRWVYGKSGYLRAVSSLSGYLVIADPKQPTRAKKTVIFSILVNGFTPPISNHDIKGLQEKIVQQIDIELAR